MRNTCRPAVLLFALLSTTLLASPQADAGSFRFALLSDTHVGNPTGADDLRRSVADLNAQTDIAFVLLSGDITEFGSNAQLREARSILDSLHHPWYIIPGNHDTKWSESGCTAFARIFGSDRFVMRWEGIVFLGLHQGPVMRMGDGHFAPEDIAWLDSVLATIPASEPLVFVTHYGLDPGIDNWYEVSRRLRQRNMLAVLHGHGHRNRAGVEDALPAVMGRSNLRAKAERGGYTLIDVRGDSMVFSEKDPGLNATPPWYVLTDAERSRASSEEPLPLPDFSVNALPGSPREAWSFSCGASVTTPPAIAGNLVIVGDALGHVRALDLDSGTPRWEYRAGAPVHSTPAVADNRVIFGSADGAVHCLDASDGLELWKLPTRGPVLGAPAIARGTVYIGASDSSLRAIALATGVLQWEFHGLEGFVETRPLVTDGRVIFGAWDRHLYALDQESGRVLWKWSNGSPSVGLSPGACWPVAAAAKVFIVAPDRFMTALDEATGRQLWRSKRYQVREALGISSDRKTVFARTMRDTVIAVRADADTMEMEWLTDAGFGYDIAPCMLIEDEGEVIFGTKNGLVIALERTTGTLRWKHKIGVTVVATPVPVPGGLLVTDLDGRVVRLERASD
jgi:outer membrane protein assembly factor BamB/predicted phosphodiesterase